MKCTHVNNYTWLQHAQSRLSLHPNKAGLVPGLLGFDFGLFYSSLSWLIHFNGWWSLSWLCYDVYIYWLVQCLSPVASWPLHIHYASYSDVRAWSITEDEMEKIAYTWKWDCVLWEQHGRRLTKTLVKRNAESREQREGRGRDSEKWWISRLLYETKHLQPNYLCFSPLCW